MTEETLLRREREETQFFDAKVAVGKKDYKCLKKILDTKEFDIDMQTPNSNGTLLHTAVSTGRQDIMDLLIEHGADVNARCYENGATPLIIAGMENKHQTAIYLIKHKAVATLRDKYGLKSMNYFNKHVKT